MKRRILITFLTILSMFCVLSFHAKGQMVFADFGDLYHTFDNPNNYGTSENDRFGYSVAISDSHAIVGAYKEDDSDGNSSGVAYVFDLSTGNLLHTFENPNNYGTSENDYFGYSVAISDSHAIVGAYAEDDADGDSSGVAYVFELSTESYTVTFDSNDGSSVDPITEDY